MCIRDSPLADLRMDAELPGVEQQDLSVLHRYDEHPAVGAEADPRRALLHGAHDLPPPGEVDRDDLARVHVGEVEAPAVPAGTFRENEAVEQDARLGLHRRSPPRAEARGAVSG